MRIHGLSSLIFKPIVEEISTSKEDEFAAKMKKALESEKSSALQGIDRYAQSFQRGAHHHPNENDKSQSPTASTGETAINDGVDSSNSNVKKIDIPI